jgi:hypothetical protein
MSQYVAGQLPKQFEVLAGNIPYNMSVFSNDQAAYTLNISFHFSVNAQAFSGFNVSLNRG